MIFQTKLALQYLLGRKTRTLLTTLSIVIGVMIVFGLNGLTPAVEDSFRQGLMASANQVDLTVTSEMRGVFDTSLLNTVRGTPGVAYATGSLVRPVLLPPDQAPPTTDGLPINSLMVYGLDPDSAREVHPLSLGEGRFLEAGDGDVILISESLAEKTGLGLVDTLSLPSTTGTIEFKIVGIVTGRPAISTEEVYVPLAAAQELLNLPDQINTIEAQFTPGSNADAVRQAVMDRLGRGYKIGGSDPFPELQQFISMAGPTFTAFGVLALAMGGFIIFNTFRTIVIERRHDIGMLRSVGASRRTILGLFLTESLLQGVIGTAVGMVAGYLFIKGLLVAMAPVWEQRVGFSLGSPSFSPLTYVLSIGLGVGVTLVGGLFPARSASRVTPLEALRPSVGEVSWKIARRGAIVGAILIVLALLGLVSGNIGLSSLGIVLFLAGLVLVTPVLVHPIAKVFGGLLTLAFAREGHIARGNLMRQPGRAAVTASAMMIGLAVVLAVAGMVTSLISGIWEYIDKSMGADYLLMPQSAVLGGGNVGAGPQLVQDIYNIPGIASVTSLRMSPTRIDETDLQVVGIDPMTFPETSGLVFSDGDPDNAYAALGAGRYVIANDFFATQNGLAVGQDLTLQTPEGPQVYQVVGIGTDYVNQKMQTVYISQSNLEQDFHETTDLQIMVNQTENADSDQVELALQNLVKDYPALSLFASEKWREKMKQEANAKLGSLYVVLGALAIPSLIALINTLGINVLERTREIGMMRAVGATRKQVRRMILVESLLLAMAGTAFGILSGIWLGYILVEAMNVSGFVVPYFFPVAGILTTIAVGLLFGVVGALIPARQAARLDVVTALAYE